MAHVPNITSVMYKERIGAYRNFNAEMHRYKLFLQNITFLHLQLQIDYLFVHVKNISLMWRQCVTQNIRMIRTKSKRLLLIY